jgi:alcohol dehydrogenase (cytochrome c)
VPVLVDAPFNGAPRKLLMQASRNGYFFVLDRVTGKNLLTKPFAAVNWAKGIDAEGRPIPDPAKEPSRDGVLIAPNESGATNYRSPSFDAKAGVLIVSAQDHGIYFQTEHGSNGWRAPTTTSMAARGCARSTIRPVPSAEPRSRRRRVRRRSSTTESGLTFTGDTAGNALALRTSDGATLWHAGIGKVGTPPVTYELDGRQYMLIGGGSALYAWALP